MASLSWVRLTRRVTGIVQQNELPNLEALIDAEAERQPTRTYFILSCAIPASIATFGGLSVFLAWISGNSGLTLLPGSIATVLLSAAAWYIFFRLYRSVPKSLRYLRDLIAKFSEKYASFGNIVLGEQSLSPQFAPILDEAAGIYLKHSFDGRKSNAATPEKAHKALEEAMTKLMETALLKEIEAQNLALTWAEPMLVEMRKLDQTLTENALRSHRLAPADPLANLREAREELETNNTAISELEEHLKSD